MRLDDEFCRNSDAKMNRQIVQDRFVNHFVRRWWTSVVSHSKRKISPLCFYVYGSVRYIRGRVFIGMAGKTNFNFYKMAIWL